VLLPSKELVELSKRYDICLSGKKTPPGCDIRFRQFYWLMVYDDAGELRSACRLADELTKGRKSGLTIPEALVATVDNGLKAECSLEELERRYVEARGSEKAYLALRKKIDNLAGVGQMRVAAFLKDVAEETDDAPLSRARGIHVDAAACNHQVINHAAYAKLRRSIESFVLDHPTHPACHDLIKPLGNVALKYTFDLSAKCESYARTWTSRDGSKAARESFASLSKQLLE